MGIVANRKIWILVIGACVGAAYLVHVWHYAFVQDDAYVFLRYARNLMEGYGPVWNPGDRVEGYTSPLWLLILTILFLFTSQPEGFLQVPTITLGLGTLALTYHLGSRLGGARTVGLVAAVLLAVDRTFAVWSTSGMDTRLYGFLTLSVVAVAMRKDSDRTITGALTVGVVAVLLSLARPEGLMLSALALAFLLLRGSGDVKPKYALAGVALWAGGVSIHVAWRIWYYGRLLPNTFYAKQSGNGLAAGAAYLGEFASSFPVTAAAFVLCAAIALGRIRRDRPCALLGAMMLAISAYLLLIGGDFMEFRMLDVVLPPACILLAVYLCRLRFSWMWRHARTATIVLVSLVVSSSVYCGLTFERSPHRVLPWSGMGKGTTDLWVVIGRWFGQIARPGESIATTAAGAIPYFSKMRCVDMLGLNDAYVATLPPNPGAPPGHQRMAPAEYLREQRITFVLGHPLVQLRRPDVPIAPGYFAMKVENGGDKVLDGRDFYLHAMTVLDRDALIASLRARGVVVIDWR